MAVRSTFLFSFPSNSCMHFLRMINGWYFFAFLPQFLSCIFFHVYIRIKNHLESLVEYNLFSFLYKRQPFRDSHNNTRNNCQTHLTFFCLPMSFQHSFIPRTIKLKRLLISHSTLHYYINKAIFRLMNLLQRQENICKEIRFPVSGEIV